MFCYFLLLFLMVVSFVSYFLLLKGVRFVTFFTVCNFDKLLFTVPGGSGFILYSLCDRERVHLDFSPSFFLLLKGRGVEVNVSFFPRYMKRWKEEGEKGTLGFSGNVFFIVEKVGRGSLGVIFFTNSLWDGERVHFDFFSSFFTVEGEGGGG